MAMSLKWHDHPVRVKYEVTPYKGDGPALVPSLQTDVPSWLALYPTS